MHPLQSSSPLIVYLDFKSPYAYLAKDPTWQLEADFGIEIDWRPLTLDIPSFLGSAKVNNAGRVVESNRTPRQWQGVRYAYMDAKRYARLKDIQIYGPRKIWDSSLAAIGMLWTRADRAVLRAYMDLVYERFWKRQLDIEDANVVAAVIAEAGGDGEGYRNYASRRRSPRPRRVAGAAASRWPLRRAELRAERRGVLRTRTSADGALDARRPARPRTRHRLRQVFVIRGAHGVRRMASASIELAFDFTSAASLLAFTPACTLADELGLAIRCVPFPTQTRAREPAREDETVSERHLRVRAEYVARDTARYANAQGIEMNRNADGVDSALACAGCLWANRHGVGRAYVQRTLLPFWAARLDIEDASAIAGVLADLGAPDFADHDAGELARHKAALEERGVFNVPTFLVADQQFVGRQHLPMIRWLLTGQEGPGPL